MLWQDSLFFGQKGITVTLTIDNSVMERRLDAIRTDLKLHFKECGPRFLYNPKYAERSFIIAAEGTVLDEPECAIGGTINRSALKETVTENELAKLVRILTKEGYRLTMCVKGGDKAHGRWIKFKTIYYRGDSK